ncbi:hypothetical protein TNCV_5038761 [Trichonephila clavipes]|nr:hypothetical protein TNCV_5038761 [Trichonephila clavipes]
MLQNANAVLRKVHLHVWLHVALLVPQGVIEPFFVWFARSLMPVLPQFDVLLHLTLLLLDEYDDLGWSVTKSPRVAGQ